MGSILKNSKSGIIDIGSNTIRLCLYTNKKNVLNNYYTQKDYFGLQKYIYNNVDPIKPIMKMISVVSDMKMESNKYGVDPFIIGTSAIREISKIVDVKKLFFEKTDIKLNILSPENEGLYSFTGAIDNLKPKNKGMLFDLGGGSLEVGDYNNKKISNISSIHLGALSLSMRFLNKNRVTSKSLNKCSSYINNSLEKINFSNEYDDLIGIGGTIRNLGKIKLVGNNSKNLKKDLNNLEITDDEIEDIIETLIISDQGSLEDIKGLNPNRYKTILPGALVIRELLKISKQKHIRISVKGIREGYIITH